MRIGDRLARLEARHPPPVRHWDFARTSDADLEFVERAGHRYVAMDAMPAEIAVRLKRILGETRHAYS